VADVRWRAAVAWGRLQRLYEAETGRAPTPEERAEVAGLGLESEELRAEPRRLWAESGAGDHDQ
jgi:hypothetical protein